MAAGLATGSTDDAATGQRLDADRDARAPSLGVASFQFDLFVAAPPERVFRLWTSPDRWPEWIGGLTRVTDLSGPPDQAGTRYVSWFGPMASRSEVLEAEPPHRIRTHIASWLLRGGVETTFVAEASGTRLTERFETEGVISAVVGRIFAAGTYRGSFRGELREFARIAEREAQADRPAP